MRQLVLSAIVVVALAVLTWAPSVSSQVPTDLPQLSYVATAHQLGVVGYRDPAGAISPDGKRFAYAEGRFIRIVPIGGGAPVTLPAAEQQVRFLAWTSNDTVASVPPPSSFAMADGRAACIKDRRLVIPCDGTKQVLQPDVDVIGPIAFAADRVYFASPAENGMVALWTADLATKRARRLTSFSRDTYAPTIGGNTVVFKTQTYRTVLADVPASGGAARQLTTFQSETPSYHPTQSLIAFTYGTWRRILDDANYPDIAQDIGVIDVSRPVPFDAPASVVTKSDSEDQAMAWSPNGKWIAFHSHREMSDDVWLRPVDLSTVAPAKVDGSQQDKRITFLGRGAETGWPRWSPDGKNVLFSARKRVNGQSVVYVIGVNQDSGAVAPDVRPIAMEGFGAGEITHAEWIGNDVVVALVQEGNGRHAIVSAPVAGGKPRVVHRYATEHNFSGMAISPDGRWVAFAAPAADGFFQIFKKEIAGTAPPIQLTSDPSNKTQPAFSPDASRVAFTVWSYEAAFWSFRER